MALVHLPEKKSHPVERELQARAPSSAIGNCVVLTAVIAIFWEHSTLSLLAGLNILVNLLRLWWSKKLDVFESKISIWNGFLSFLILTIGILWGIIAAISILSFGTISNNNVLVLFIVSGITASAVAGLSARLTLAVTYLIGALGIPMVVLTFFTQPSGNEKFLPLFIFVYMIFLYAQGKVQHKKFMNMIHQRELLHTIVDSIPLGIMLRSYKNQNTQIEILNPKAKEILNLTESSIGKNISDLFQEGIAQKIHAHDQQAVNSKNIQTYSFQLARLQNDSRHINAQSIYLEELKAVLEIINDVTKEVESAKQIKELQAVSIHREKMASLGEMAGGVAHEINNPLAIIKGKINQINRLINTPGEIDKDKIDECLYKIDSTTARIAKITNGLLTFSRSGENDPAHLASLLKICNDTLYMTSERFKHSNIELVIDAKEDVEINCREVQITQVLVNLVNNAYDAVQNYPEKWVKISIEKQPQHALIRVTDSGHGIKDPELVNKLMQPFFTTKEVGKGTGLGLSISKGLIENHGGQLYLNQQAKHTEFIVKLPLVS